MAELTNCTQCASSGLARQFGEFTRVCRRLPPQVILVPKAPGQFSATSVFPCVDDSMRCDQFTLAEVARKVAS